MDRRGVCVIDGLPRPPYNRPVALSAAASCHHHAGREAIGICVHCRTPVCTECSTKVDGINHCVTCLHSRSVSAAKVDTQGPRRVHPGVAIAGASVSLGMLSLLVWLMLAVLLPEAP